MDYIRQINAFENLNEFNEIGPGAQLLWYKLMRVANLSGWQNELSISNTRLQSMTKTSEKTLINNRNQLIQNGLLQYKKRGRTKAGLYVLTDLTSKSQMKTVSSSADKPTDPLPKTEEIYEKDTDKGEYPAELVQRLYNKFPSGILQSALVEWLQKWPRDMICVAIQSSFDYGIPLESLKPYINRIFENWVLKGIDTAQKARDANDAFKKRQAQQSVPNNKKPIRKEPIPEWFGKEDEYVEEPMDPAMEAEIKEKLRKYQESKASQEVRNE